MAASTKSAPARAFDHPVIDSDGHFVEFLPALLEYLRGEVGPEKELDLGR